jgi:predicted acetyltransferase
MGQITGTECPWKASFMITDEVHKMPENTQDNQEHCDATELESEAQKQAFLEWMQELANIVKEQNNNDY